MQRNIVMDSVMTHFADVKLIVITGIFASCLKNSV